MSLITDLREVPKQLSVASKCTIVDGIVYFAMGGCLSRDTLGMMGDASEA
ncbi:hypothetical protein [Bradyrhizobium sp. WD16]|nr:hypothetical protein [Bradyrhizobium sp. WD16]